MKMKRSSLLRVLYFPCLAALMVTVFLLTFSVNVFAAGNEPDSYFPIDQNENGLIPDDIIEYFESTYSGDYNYIVRFWGYNSSFNEYYVYMLLVPKENDFSLFGEISNNGYQFSIYNVGSVSTGIINGYLGFRSGNVSDFWNGGQNISGWQGLNSSKYDSSVDYITNFKLLTNNTSSASPVINFGSEPSFDMPTLGHAKPYDPLNIPIFGTGLVPPHAVPIPFVPQSHSWGNYTPPTFDSSDPIKSLYDITNYNFGYLKDNLTGSINTLGSNIAGMGNQISSTIQYYGGLIVDGINNGIKTFYNNMVSLLEPITVPFLTIVAMGTDPETGLFSVPYLTQTLFMPDVGDMAEIMAANDSLHIINNVDRIVDKVWLAETSIIKTIHNVIPVKKFHIPSCYFHGQQIGDFDIDFSWFEFYKTYTDVIIGTFLVIGWIYWFFVSCSHILRYGKTYDYDEHEIGGGAGIGVRF